MPIDQRPATGRRVLLRHKKALLAMTASLALLAGLASAEAFPFDWPFNAFQQPSVTRHRAPPVRRARPEVARPEVANPAANVALRGRSG